MRRSDMSTVAIPACVVCIVTGLKPGMQYVNCIGRRVIMCMLLIAVLAVIWNLLGR
jgi:hypothetical protein